MTKSSILGVVVFGLYEYLVLQRVNQQKDAGHNRQKIFVNVYCKVAADETNQTPRSAQMSVHPSTSAVHTLLPITYHMAAGALAGACQSIVLDGYEIFSYWVHRHQYRHLHGGHAPDMISLVNTSLVIRRLVHHSLGYMTLFGTYECLRRQGQNHIRNILQSGEPWVADRLDWLLEQGIISTRKSTLANDDKELYDLTSVPLFISFGAGGFAGQAHYIVSHYLRQWRKATDHGHHHVVRHVRVGTTCMAFLPTAISFMAFQYGGEITERVLALEEA